jgi:hypothetical protein
MKHIFRVCSLFILLSFLFFWSVSIALAVEMPRFECILANGEKIFTPFPKGRCSRRPLDDGWQSFVFGETILIDYHSTSVLREADGVKAWVQILFATPASLSPRGKYNYMRSSYKLFCNTRQQLLIQGTYKLGNKTVWERLSNASIKEEIEPGTVSDRLLRFFCRDMPSVPQEGASPITEFSDAEFDAQFKCPESLVSEDEQKAATRDFLDWIGARHPTWNTLREIGVSRMYFLERHNCSETLNNIRRKGSQD